MPRYDGTNTKKRKHNHISKADASAQDTSKPTAIFKASKPRQHTLTVALPGSIIANAQSHDLKTSLAGTLARALSVFCVDEVVIFDDGHSNSRPHANGTDSDPSYTGFSDPSHFLAHLLSYLETPPHLRRHLFPIHPNLRTAGTLPSLDLPHHLRPGEWCRYREGVTLPAAHEDGTTTHASADTRSHKSKSKPKKSNSSPPNPPSTPVDAGLPHPITIPLSIHPHTRVTLDFQHTTPPPTVSPTDKHIPTDWAALPAKAVAPDAPRTQGGFYWGYSVRSAPSLSAVFTEPPFAGGYDVSVGTSERGMPLADLLRAMRALGEGEGDGVRASVESEVEEEDERRAKLRALKRYSHLLLVFGGVAGLEAAAANDSQLRGMGVQKPESLFDWYVNLVPGQGSRTVRTEEAVWVGLMGLRGVVEGRGALVDGEDGAGDEDGE